MSSDIPSLDELTAFFEAHGVTDRRYLAQHYRRFRSTLDEFLATSSAGVDGKAVLDIGAHWLHQAVLWQRAGCTVTAVDVAATFELPQVQSAAAAEQIHLCTTSDLGEGAGLEELAESHFDVVLFTEIIEHIAFNPVTLWREIYRVMAPGGTIVLTTPNHYYWAGRAWRLDRFLRGLGSGIPVDEVIRIPTYGHHWKEYSRKEIGRYFELLSPDFRVVKSLAVRNYLPPSPVKAKRAIRRVMETVPPIRPFLHVEIVLDAKRHGITAQPRW